MNSKELFQAGRLADAIKALGAELREIPSDTRRRTFLFELLCFAGEFDRAEKHLDILADSSKDASLGALLYRAALNAERTRADLFQKRDYPSTPAPAVSGTINGKPFEELSDGDPRIGPRLEVYAAGQYLWIPFAHIKIIDMQPPRRLRDLLWAPALIHTGPAFKDRELGEVLIPVLTPLAWQHQDDAVRLGPAHAVGGDSRTGRSSPPGRSRCWWTARTSPSWNCRHLEIHAERGRRRKPCRCAVTFSIPYRAIIPVGKASATRLFTTRSRRRGVRTMTPHRANGRVSAR